MGFEDSKLSVGALAFLVGMVVTASTVAISVFLFLDARYCNSEGEADTRFMGKVEFVGVESYTVPNFRNSPQPSFIPNSDDADRDPVMGAIRDVGFSCILTDGKSRHEAQTLQRREGLCHADTNSNT